MQKRSHKAFTLIELLIVVLIIAILAAIAIPNFLEFQTRAKVSRVKSDHRTLATAIEAYCVDEGTYPAPTWQRNPSWYHVYELLSTPIAYITTMPRDPFTSSEQGFLIQYEYGAGKEGGNPGYAWREWPTPNEYPCDAWFLDGIGPDRIQQTDYPTNYYPWVYMDMTDLPILIGNIYDPTNGTVSKGQIQRSGGAPLNGPPRNIWQQIIQR